MDRATAPALGDVLRINVILVIVILVSLASSFNPQWHIWGLDYIAILPAWFRLFLTAALVVCALPAMSRKLGIALSGLLGSMTNIRASIIYVMISLALLGLFILLSSNNHLLGDGYWIHRNIASGQLSSPNEPLDYLLHHSVSAILGGGENGALLAYRTCSYLAGALFLIGLYTFIKSKSDLLLALLVSLSFTSLQFFFGYMESYTFTFVFSVLYFLSAARDLNKKKISPITLADLLLAIGFHVMGAILIPSFIYLVLTVYRIRRAFLITAIIFMVTAGIGVCYLKFISGTDIGQIFVPLRPTSDNPYHFFSHDHLSDLLNILLLDYPMLLLIPFAGHLRRIRGFLFYWIAAFPALAMVVIINPKLGALRDWDLLSVASAPIMIYLIQAFLAWRRLDKRAAYSLVMPLAVFAFLHTGGWIFLNNAKAVSYLTVRDAVRRDIHYSRAYYSGFMNEFWSLAVEKAYGDMEEVIRARQERYIADPDDASNTSGLALAFMTAGDTEKAVALVGDNWKRFLDNPDVLFGLGSIMFQTMHFEDAEKIYQSYSDSQGTDHRILHDLGVLKEHRGQADSAFYFYDLAFRSWKDAPVDLEMEFYLTSIRRGYSSIASDGLERILPKLLQSQRLTVGQLLQSIAREDSRQVDSLCTLLRSALKIRTPARR